MDPNQMQPQPGQDQMMMQMDPNMVDMNGQPIMQPMVGPDGQPIMMDGNQMAYTQEQIDVSFSILKRKPFLLIDSPELLYKEKSIAVMTILTKL